MGPLDERGRAKAKNTAIPARSTYSRVEVFLYPFTYNTNCYVIGASQNKRFFTRYFTRRPWCLMGVVAEVGLKIVATWATENLIKCVGVAHSFRVFFHGLLIYIYIYFLITDHRIGGTTLSTDHLQLTIGLKTFERAGKRFPTSVSNYVLGY